MPAVTGRRSTRATGAQREATRELVRAAVEAAEAGDVGTGAAFEEKVGSTLRAAAADPDVAEQLVAGRLVREQEAAGLFGFDAAVAAPARERAPPRKRGTAKKKSSKKPSSGKEKSADAASREEAAERRRAEETERKRLRALEAARRPSSGHAAPPRRPSGPRPRSAGRPSARCSG